MRALLIAGLVLVPAFANAQTATPAPTTAPSPAASAAPSGASDPCLSMSSLVSRPSVTTSSCSVKKNDVLIESGYTNTSTSGSAATSTILYPQANLRVGLGNNLEFDLNPSSYERASTTPKSSGATDTSLGAHYEFGYTSKTIFATNVVYTTNSGTPAFSGNGDGVLVNLDGVYTLSPVFGFFGTFGYENQSAGTVSTFARYHGFAPSLGLSASLPQGFNAYVEGFGMTSSGPGADGRYGIDGGIQKDLGSRLQLDVNLYDYPGAQGGAHTSAVGFGAAYLFGPH